MQVKTVKDYYDSVCEKFKGVPRKDIIKILNYGWKVYYLHNQYGGDVLIQGPGFWSYTGSIFKDPLRHFEYYVKKLSIKVRIQYKKKRIPFNGYYYFGLNQKEYDAYTSQNKKRGRKKKHYTFNKIKMFKILDECKLVGFNKQYIFRIEYPIDLGYSIYKEEFTTDKAELIEVRDIQKFKDILISNYDYKAL